MPPTLPVLRPNQLPFNTTTETESMRVAKSIPALPKGNDAAVAAQLQTLVADANDGLRRILAAGFFIECIAGELKHGQLGPWLAAHCPQVGQSTVYRWRELARNVAQVAGVKIPTVGILEGEFTGGNFLTLPSEDLPNEVLEARQRIEEVIAGKTAKQLCFEFKQMEDGKVKVGRLKGSGGREPGPAASPSELLAHEQHCAQRDLALLVRDLDALAPRVPLLNDPDVSVLLSILDRWQGALRDWERTPQARRTAEAGKALALTLKP